MFSRTWQRLSSVVLGSLAVPTVMADRDKSIYFRTTHVNFLDLCMDRSRCVWRYVLLHF
jgi:hypothetical protein